MDHLVLNLVVLSRSKLLLLICYYLLICCKQYDHFLFWNDFASIVGWFCLYRFKNLLFKLSKPSFLYATPLRDIPLTKFLAATDGLKR